MKTLTIPEALKEKDLTPDIAGSLYQLYKFVNPELEVMNFIKKYNLLALLLEAPWEIRRVFGDDIVLELELHHDPEEGWDELFIVIRSAYSAEEAIRLENRLTEEWFLDRIKETRGKLNITEEPL